LARAVLDALRRGLPTRSACAAFACRRPEPEDVWRRRGRWRPPSPARGMGDRGGRGRCVDCGPRGPPAGPPDPLRMRNVRHLRPDTAGCWKKTGGRWRPLPPARGARD